MKKLSLLILLFCSLLAFGQIGMVSQKIQQLNQTNKQFTSYELFTKNGETGKTAKYTDAVSKVMILNLNSTELNKIVNDAPELLSVSVPFNDKNVEVELYKQNVLADSFFATDESGNVINYTPGEYYRGIVKGDNSSLVAISFFENDVMGVISTTQDGNIVLGKSTDQQDYIAYSDLDLLAENPFSCGADELPYNQQIEDQLSFDPMAAHHAPETTNCVKIYYEIAYKPFQLKGQDLTQTLNWITGIQNNIGTLYNNDGINTSISQVRIWTYQDPYNGNYGENLDQFRETVKDFDGDIAHLVNYPATTSVAYLDSLCTDYNYAYSGISMGYSQVPTYSWTIMAMTHEMGHAMGSPHTHACAWNGNNTAIDGCGPAAGYGEGCNGPIPSEGGTLMSYCHLLSVGINFNLGFGPQPGQLIRDNVDSKPCLSTDCVTNPPVCTYAIKKLTTTYLNSMDIQIDIDDTFSDLWRYQAVLFGNTPDENGWTETTTTSFTLTNLTPNVYYEVYVVNICEDGSPGAMKAAILLPGDFCDGTLFTDTGGTNGSYESNQHFSKTFFPSVNGGKVRLSFAKIGLQPNKDFMYVHDGDSLNAPLFANGTITNNHNPGPEFVSTHSSGAITIEFISDSSGSTYGWEATIDCDAMGLSEVSDQYGILVYPNPADDVLNVVSQKSKIESVKMTDTAGRTVLSNQFDSMNEKINIGHLPKGVYILTLKVDGKWLTKKIIKK